MSYDLQHTAHILDGCEDVVRQYQAEVERLRRIEAATVRFVAAKDAHDKARDDGLLTHHVEATGIVRVPWLKEYIESEIALRAALAEPAT